MDFIKNEALYRIYVDRMKVELLTLIDECFGGTVDASVCWKLFYENLRKIKKQHINIYEEFLDVDNQSDDETEYPDSEYIKHLKNNGLIKK